MDTLDSIIEQELAEEQKAAAAKREIDADVEALRWIMGHKPGRRFVWSILAKSGVFRNPWRPSSQETAYHAGAMALGQQLWADLHEFCADKLIDLLKEHRNVGKQRSERKPS